MWAPDRLVDWWRTYRKAHRTFPIEVSYHPRSDEHSKALCEMVMEDLLRTCEAVRSHANAGQICFQVNHTVFRRDGTKKVLDLVIGQPEQPVPPSDSIHRGVVVTPGIRIALEAKACMTKHTASKPRLRDELTGSMRSAIQGNPGAIVCGVCVVNFSESFVSPTDQPDPLPTEVRDLRRRYHRQPQDTTGVVEMLGRLPIRASATEDGFDAFAIIVVDHDNEVPEPRVRLVNTPPSPEPASPRSYKSFLIDVCNKYKQRFQ